MDRQKDACTEVQLGGQPHIRMERNTNIPQTETVYKAVLCRQMTCLLAEEDFSDSFA